ncbi:MAG: YvcK family protein [Caldisericales bacterium]|nr:YvcK family protein [Caldisericales bacterium]
MKTKDLIRIVYRPGAGVKRWFFLTLIAGIVISLGILTLDWTSGSQRIMGWINDLFVRITENTSLPAWFLPVVGWLTIGIGVAIAVSSSIQSIISMLRVVGQPSTKAVKNSGPKVVVLGGGTGIHPVLLALKSIGASVTAVVTIADSGGSTGKLRQEFSMLAPGDIRQCLLALSDQPLFDKIIRYRFSGQNSSLSGHSMGNLVIAALTETEGDFTEAVFRLSKLMATKGTVIPFTIDDVSLCAKYDDGTVVSGEANIPKVNKPIKNVFFNPPYAKPYVRVIEAIAEADFVIVGPGSLYTSIMPTLLLAPIVDTMVNSKARKIFMANVMTEPGETNGYSITDHITAIKKHTNADIFDMVISSNTPLPEEVLEKYKQSNATPLYAIPEDMAFTTNLLAEDLATIDDGLARHSVQKLSRVLSRIIFRGRNA